MQEGTLAERLGITTHLSPLLMKLRRLGIGSPADLERLAVRRGLRYYDLHGDSAEGLDDSETSSDIATVALSNEELAIALLCPAAPYSQHRLRMAAAMLAADGNRPEKLAHLAIQERSETIVIHIATCGRKVEPDNPFWEKLLDLLPSRAVRVRPDALPHPSRFVAMTGITRAGVGKSSQWIRPRVTVPQLS